MLDHRFSEAQDYRNRSINRLSKELWVKFSFREEIQVPATHI